MTSPFSIYILIGLTYPDYKAEPFVAYIDSSSELCLAKSDCFPPEYHATLPDIQGKDISNQDIILRKIIKTPKILIDKYVIKLPSVYFHTTRCDILLGNNFLQLFKTIIQNNVFHYLRFKVPCNHWITAPRLHRAFARTTLISFKPCTQRGDFPINSPTKDFDRKNPLLKFNIRLLHKLDLSTQLQKKLESLYVDNPLQFWDNNKIILLVN